MPPLSGSDDEIKHLLRELIASNLTVALEIELLRREMKGKEAGEHPLSPVLEHFEMIQDVLDPADEEEDLASALLSSRRPAAPTRGNPFSATMRYVKPRSRRADEDDQ